LLDRAVSRDVAERPFPHPGRRFGFAGALQVSSRVKVGLIAKGGISALLHQQTDSSQMAHSRSHHQWRCTVRGLSINKRMMFVEEPAQHFQLPAGCRVVKRCPALPVDLRPALNQQIGHCPIPMEGSEHQRRFSRCVGLVHLGFVE
jgi:hypothetical protein